MNIYSLLDNKGIDLKEITRLFREKDYRKIYNVYTNAVSHLILITTEDEFDDFMEMGGEIEEEAFLLSLAYEKGMCCCLGMYEENAGAALQQFVKQASQIDINCDELNNDSGLNIDFVKKINNATKSSKSQYIALLDSTYCEGCYYIFQVPDSEYNEEWESGLIERVV